MKSFNFRKTIMRNDFTTIFGGVGQRRLITDYNPKRKLLALQFRMVWIRRSHQGWRNRVYGSIIAIKLRLQYGRRKGVPQFRR